MDNQIIILEISKKKLYEKLLSEIEGINDNREIFILGDLNVRLGKR